MSNTCDVCETPWTVKFEWDYTSGEHYCDACLLTPIPEQAPKRLLDFLPDCQQITWRPDPTLPRWVVLTSTAQLQALLSVPVSDG